MWFLTAVLLMAQDVPTVLPDDQIRYEVTDRNRTTMWIAHADGRVTYSVYGGRDRVFADAELSVPSEAVVDMFSELRPLETAQRLTCPAPQRRAPEANIAWSRGIRTVELKLLQGCGGREVADAFDTLIGAGRNAPSLVGNDQWENRLATDDRPSVTLKRLPDAGIADIEPAQDHVDAIAYRGLGPRGVNRGKWQIDRQGRGSFQFYRDMDDHPVTRTFSYDPAEFERVLTLIAPIETIQTRCSEVIELHAAVDMWSWIRKDQTTTMQLEGVCLLPAAQQADAIVREWIPRER